MDEATSTDSSNLVVLVPEAQPIVDAVNRRLPEDRRLTAPAHITLIYPFMPPSRLPASAVRDLGEFFFGQRSLRFELTLGWFGREVLILRPEPDSELIDLTKAIIARWPEYPYYGGVYDNIEPHLSLGFGAAQELEPIATVVTAHGPFYVEAAAVTLLVGPHERMRPGPTFPLGAVGDERVRLRLHDPVDDPIGVRVSSGQQLIRRG